MQNKQIIKSKVKKNSVQDFFKEWEKKWMKYR